MSETQASTRMGRYAELPEGFKTLYSSDASTALHTQMINKYRIENEGAYIDAVGDVILGFHKTTELPGLLVKEAGLTPEVAAKIVADLAEFLSPVLAREKEQQGQGAMVQLQPKVAPVTTTATEGGQTAPVTPAAPVAAPAPVAPTAPSVSSETSTFTPPTEPAGNAAVPSDLAQLSQHFANRTPAMPTVNADKTAALAAQMVMHSEPVPVPMADTPATPPPAATPGVSTAAAEEEQISSVPNRDVSAVRTMAGDMQKVHGYGAFRQDGEGDKQVTQSQSQDDLLHPKKALSAVPSVE